MAVIGFMHIAMVEWGRITTALFMIGPLVLALLALGLLLCAPSSIFDTRFSRILLEQSIRNKSTERSFY